MIGQVILSNPDGAEIFRARPVWPWIPLSLLYNGQSDFPGGKAAWAGRWPHIPYNAEEKERVQLSLLPLCPSVACFSVNFICFYKSVNTESCEKQKYGSFHVTPCFDPASNCFGDYLCLQHQVEVFYLYISKPL